MGFSRSRLLVAFLGVSALAAVAILRWVRVTRETPAEIVADAQSDPEMPRVRVPLGTRSAPAKRVEIDNRLTGRVVSAEGVPLAKCAVSLSTWGASAWGEIGERERLHERMAFTDAEGRYVFEDVAPRGAYRLFAELAGHPAVDVLSSWIAERGTFEQVPIVLAPRADEETLVTSPYEWPDTSATVTGRVFVRGTNTPVKAFDVRLREGSPTGWLSAIPETAQHVESESGEFTIRASPMRGADAEWRGCVEVLAPGIGAGNSACFEFSETTRVADLRVDVSTGAAVAGRVVDRAGSPVPGVRVRALDAGGSLDFDKLGVLEISGQCAALAVSDAEGRFELRDLAREVSCVADEQAHSRYDIVFDARDFAYEWRRELVALSGQRIELGDTTLAVGASVRVRVVDERGEFARSAIVVLNDVEGTEFTGFMRTDEFRFEHVRAGVCTVRAYPLHDGPMEYGGLRRLGEGVNYRLIDDVETVAHVNFVR